MSRILKIITNKYFITFIAFLLLMLFFDQNDWFTQRERRKQLDATQQNIDFLRGESERMEREIDELNSNPKYLEQYAREKYHEKRDNEDVYLIIHDSVKQEQQLKQ